MPEMSQEAESPEPTAGPEQSYESALRIVCNVDRLGNVNNADPLEESAQRQDYLASNIKNPDAIYFLTVFRTRPAQDQSDLLSREAATQNVTPCPLVTALRAATAQN
jgi:hypothetical protein